MLTTRNLSVSVLCGLISLLSVQQGESFHVSLPSSSRIQSLSKVSGRVSTGPSVRFTSPAILNQNIAKLPRGETSQLSMYNLPPGGGGSRNELADIAKGALGLVLVVGFFASPLGGFVLGIFNSFLLLALLLPALGTVGFQAWQYFNTISGACPNCGAPAKVLKAKDGESTPTVCFNCGAVLQANYDNSGIDNVTGRNTIDNLEAPSSIFDIFGAGPETYTTTTTYEETTYYDTPSSPSSRKSKPSGSSSNIIDVEIEDDKPFQ